MNNSISKFHAFTNKNDFEVMLDSIKSGFKFYEQPSLKTLTKFYSKFLTSNILNLITKLFYPLFNATISQMRKQSMFNNLLSVRNIRDASNTAQLNRSIYIGRCCIFQKMKDNDQRNLLPRRQYWYESKLIPRPLLFTLWGHISTLYDNHDM